MTDERDNFLTTTPGTQMQWTVRLRKRPCWKCRLRALLGRPKRHFNCPPFPEIKEYVP